MNRSHFLKAALLTPFVACVPRNEPPAPTQPPSSDPLKEDKAFADTSFMAVENAVGHNVLYLGPDGNVKWVTTAVLK